MDPTVTLGGVVAALVAKAVETAGTRLAANSAAALRRLVDCLRARFAKEADAEATRALERLEEAPDSPSRLSDLAVAVDRHIEEVEVRALIDGVGTAG